MLVGAIVLSFSFPSTPFASSASAEALHTSGHKIFDANNNEVYIRGVGRAGDIDSITGNWGGEGDAVFSYSYKWLNNMTELTLRMDETFRCMRDVWHANAIRAFVPVNWWWEDNINPYQEYGQGPNQIMSNRNYWELVIQRAQATGIYVILCPNEVFDYYTRESIGRGGQPLALTSAGSAYMSSIDPDEMQAWRLWWTSVVDRLGSYPNVIWDLWNEPDGDTSAIKSNWYSYMIEMYKTVRGLGNNNLIFAQWRQGVVPYWQEELTWIPDFHSQLTAAIGASPINMVYSCHAYRYKWNYNWEISYDEVLAQLQSQNMIGCTRSEGTDVPVIVGEMGVGLDLTGTALANELEWWESILRACKTLDVGVVGYYWTPHMGWTPDQAFVEGIWAAGQLSPTPTTAGQLFIDAALETDVTLSVSIQSPENKAYNIKDVPLSFTTSKPTQKISYSLDGTSNVTISGNTTLVGLSEGTHNITVYAEDSDGNTSSSNTVYFTVDTLPSSLKILSPENETYATSSVPLSFTVDESTSLITYSLDGQTNVTITGNTTLSELIDSSHSIVVYANDLLGNVGSSGTVHFSVDTSPPRISILSPQNTTYERSDVALNFTINELFSQITYDLDEQGNVTVAGNTTLTEVSDGSHSIVVYANDTAGNTGASETISFSIAQKPETQPEPFPTWSIVAIVVIVVVGVALLIHFAKVKKTNGKNK